MIEPDPPTTGPERLGPTRRRVLAHLQEVADPQPTESLAGALGLHPNTVRFHLDALLREGLVRKVTERRGLQGRPRALFTAAPTGRSVTDLPYRALVDALLAYVRTSEDPQHPLAEEIGEAWGRSLVGAAQTTSTDSLVDVVNGLGLTSRLVIGDGVDRLEIVRCPFRELTRHGDATVCRIHLGMMRGYLAADGADRTVSELRPWVGPELCLALLEPVDQAAATPESDP